MSTSPTAPEAVLHLVQRFNQHREDYRRGQYKEFELRREFIDPLFKALGWDVDNSQGYAEAYKEVVHEQALKIGGGTEAPDYSFRIGGVRKFFVEAKKPSVNLKDDPAPAYQLRRYAWSAKLPLSILTDFEEFAVYDCRIRPGKTDRASNARTLYLTCDQYAERWHEIAAIFSRDAILKGSFDKYAESKKAKRGTAEVDAAFLDDIERWRELLAKNIALRNQLEQRELNFAVQRTIDRIVFLRICEDRGIEPYGRLQALQNGPHIYRRLGELFRQADDRYNSGLFHFEREKGRNEAPDELSLSLTVDDKPLKEILKHLYYPESPYEFSVLGADILGQVYEQFLGKVIRLTSGRRAVVEDKPEVKKAGGVYYTPTYIVQYIVENTVGRLLDGATPRQAAKLHVIDPACGSGSFLIGAYQKLLDWHRDWYVANNPGKHTKQIYQDRTGQWRLTTDRRKQILLNNIYGVDIDPQAVEVTKLSLLLKVLEGESQESIERQRRFLHERALPDLGSNIKCGNSLIGPDFYDHQQLDLFDADERLRINVFDWEAEFPTIFKAGGFDAVIGNPPYGFHQIHAAHLKPYFKTHYIASQGSFEHYFLFYERSLKLLKKNGMHGFIVPVTWLTIPSARSLRKFVLDNFKVSQIAWLPELVFTNAQVNTLVSVIQKSAPNSILVDIHDSLGFKEPPQEQRLYSQSKFIEADYYIGIFEGHDDSEILRKMEAVSRPLGELARPCSGYNPYEVGKGTKPGGGPHTKETVLSKPYHSTKRLSRQWKPEIIGRHLGRYVVNVTGTRWIKYGPWLAAARDPENFIGPRILVQEIVGGKDRRLIAAYLDDELYYSRDVIPIKLDPDGIDGLYLLAILNSRLTSWYHHKRNPKAKKGLFPKVLVSDLRKLPIATVDLTQREDKLRYERTVKLVERMLALQKQLAQAKTAHEKTVLQRQLDATDRQIDQLVYQFYGLTDAEIRLVEEATK